MKYLLFLFNDDVMVAACNEPSQWVVNIASLVLTENYGVMKDRFGLVTAPVYSTEELDARVKFWVKCNYD